MRFSGCREVASTHQFSDMRRVNVSVNGSEMSAPVDPGVAQDTPARSRRRRSTTAGRPSRETHRNSGSRGTSGENVGNRARRHARRQPHVIRRAAYRANRANRLSSSRRKTPPTPASSATNASQPFAQRSLCAALWPPVFVTSDTGTPESSFNVCSTIFERISITPGAL
jgi:hypothetical protein